MPAHDCIFMGVYLIVSQPSSLTNYLRYLLCRSVSSIISIFCSVASSLTTTCSSITGCVFCYHSALCGAWIKGTVNSSVIIPMNINPSCSIYPNVYVIKTAVTTMGKLGVLLAVLAVIVSLYRAGLLTTDSSLHMRC